MVKKEGCVYFFRHVGLSPVKIGYSENESPISRFQSFKMYAPYGAEMLGFINCENPHKMEMELHKKYSCRRINGEWFEITEDEVSEIIKTKTTKVQSEERNSFWEEFAKRKGEVSISALTLGEKFVNFMDSKIVESIKINRTELKDEYLKFSNSNITPQKFNKKVRLYAAKKNIKLHESKYNGIFHFYFGEFN